MNLQDGLYQVTWRDICAGFVVQRGRVVACAPILRRNLARWSGTVEYVGVDPAAHPELPFQGAL